MTQLGTVNTSAVIGSFTQKELDTLKATIAKGTSDEQFSLFMQTCVSSGLNPFLNQIYCIVYQSEKNGPQMSMQIAVEGIVSLAKKHPAYKGFIASEVKENDSFEIDMVTGEPIHKITSMTRGKTLGAYCVAYREGAPNISVVVTIDQVGHLIKSNISNTQKMWRDYLDDMITKYAIKRAFKRQFGIEVAEDEVVGSSNDIDNLSSYNRVDVTPTEKPAETLKEAPKTNTPPAEDNAKKMTAARDLMNKKFAILGIEGKESKGAYISAKITLEDGQPPTYEQMEQLLKMMDADIKAKNELSDELE